ncbi:MAG: YHS domain-containing (seleno)protein [Pseudolabrys sp.]
MSSVFSGFVRLAVAIAISAIIGGAVTASPALAQTKSYQFNVDDKGLLLRGYDPVAYFTTGKPAKGSDKITASHNGATFHFVSAANRDAFAKEPDKYVPVYGGFCAYGVANGYKVDGDPEVWKIVDGKLYLNINRSVGRKFEADTKGFIQQANTKWPGMRDKSPAEVNK